MLAYLHIPFCDSKCHYCAFNSYENKGTLKQNYMQILTQQLRFELEKFNANPQSITSLFIGGGTPSTISSELYAPFFEMISPYLRDDAEITSRSQSSIGNERMDKRHESLRSQSSQLWCAEF